MSLVQMTLSGGVFILFIVVVRALALHRLPKAAFWVLWEMAALRLLLPFSIPSPFSVLVPMKRLPVVGEYLTAVEGASPPEPVTTGIVAGALAPANTASNMVLPIIWLTGMALMATYFVAFYVRTKRKFSSSTPDDAPTVRRWLAGQTLHRPLEVRQSALVSSPLTYGVLRPVILLPEDMERGDETALTYILTHEYIHIRRFDSAAKLMFAAVLCVHWFNPLAWVMYVLANRDLELSCDERVMDTLGGREKTSYALTLINMEETRSRCFSLYNHFSKLAIEERIEAIMKYKKASILAAALAVALVICATTAFATSAQGISNFPSVLPAATPDDATLVLDNLNAVPPSEIGVQDKSETTIPEQYADIDGSLSYSIGKEEENLNAPVTIGNTTLISVSHDDERKHTPEEWQQILKMIEEGKVFWSDQPTEFNTAIPVLSGDIHGAPIDKTGSTADGLPENNVIYFDTEAERDEHFRALDANMEKGLDRYTGFEEMYAGIDTSAPITYIVK